MGDDPHRDTALAGGGRGVKLPRGYPKELMGERPSGLRAVAPVRVKNAVRRGLISYGAATGRWRVLPDFLIVGAQRCGTSSLHACLAGHPALAMTRIKEVRYFDIHFGFGERWYRGYFPTRAEMALLGRRRGLPMRAGEASPDYLFYPHVPRRVADLVPGARLIVMLRDPVVRAYSHFQHESALGWETLAADQAFALEPERVGPAMARMQADPGLLDHEFQHHSYLARGHYAEQLQRWFAVFPREQLLVMASEEFYADPASAVAHVSDFLGVPRRAPGSYPRRMSLTYPPMPDELRERLVEQFRPANRRLYDMLGRDLGWPA